VVTGIAPQEETAARRQAPPAGGGPSAVARVVRALRTAVVPLALITLTALAGVVLGRVYAGDLLTRLVIGAAVGSVLVSVATRRLPSWLVAPVSMAAMAAWTLWALRLAAT